jgi:hypothetical protein
MSDEWRTAIAAVKAALGLGPRVTYYRGKAYPLTFEGRLAKIRAAAGVCGVGHQPSQEGERS